MALTRITSHIAQCLWDDLGHFAIQAVSHLQRSAEAQRSTTSEVAFDSVKELCGQLQTGRLPSGTTIRVRGRPVAFAPYLRAPYMLPVMGSNTRQRRGPRVGGILGAFMTNWTPVGLFPAFDRSVSQGTLVDTSANVFGATGIYGSTSGTTIPLLSSSAHLQALDHDCDVRGTLKLLAAEDLAGIGLTCEQYEVLRKRNGLWVLDAGSEGGVLSVRNDDNPKTELWGALYACGHFEFEGEIKLATLIEAAMETFRRQGLAPTCMRERVRGDALVAGNGARLTIGGPQTGGLFALHMDVELLRGYPSEVRAFRGLLREILSATREAFAANGNPLQNPDDVDFSYAESEDDYTVLRSAGADAIAEPVAVAIRDWHRSRAMGVVAVEVARPHGGSARVHSTPSIDAPSGADDVATYRGRVHYAVITVKPFEEDPFLARFPSERIIKGNRTYHLHRGRHESGAELLVAEVRMARPGNVESAPLTKDIITDLDPSWILLVGIGGASPFGDAVLGDVVLSTSVSDVTARMSTSDGDYEYYPGGQYAEQAVENAVTSLRGALAREARRVLPAPSLDLGKVEYTTKDEDVNQAIAKLLSTRFEDGKTRTTNFDGAIISSDENVKDVARVVQWRSFLKGALAIEMELAGVHRSARSVRGTVPVLSIRGISDIVGLKKQESWVNYAAEVAAEYARAFIKLAPIPSTRRGSAP